MQHGETARDAVNVSSVLCDRILPAKLKGKVYETIVGLAMLYRAET